VLIIPTPKLTKLERLSSVELTASPDDLWAEFGQLQIRDSTRQKYVKAIEYFCQFAYECTATPETIAQFLALDRFSALEKVLAFRRYSIDKGLSASTINVRLAAIKSLVGMARKLGKTAIDLGDVEGLPTEVYRDTRGIDVDLFRLMLDCIDPSTAIGIRDYAILRLFWGNALRRGEISSANVGDFIPQERRLSILRKGKRAKTTIDLTDGVTHALEEWLKFHPHTEPTQPSSCRTQQVDAPLFVSLSRHKYGARISGDSIYRIVRDYARAAGIERIVSPHRLRHSSITAFLDESDGNIRAAQSLSGHSNVNTLTRYDDNRKQQQKAASNLLDRLLDGKLG
jgi:integrase/recombinase XerC